MPIISMRQLLDHAAENDYGVPAFNVNNLEQIRAIMEGAKEMNSPVIVQASAGARKYAGPRFIKSMMEAAVEEFPNIPMKKVERNENPQLIKKYNVRSYPTIALSKGRKFVEFDGDRSDINMFHSFFNKNGVRTV